MRPIHDRSLRVGIWNLQKSRDPGDVRGEVRELLKEESLDVLMVFEAAGYVKSMYGAIPGYRVLCYRDGNVGARDSAIIVRNGVEVAAKRLHRLERTGWIRALRNRHAGLHNPRYMVSARIEGIRFFAVHMPPGPFTDGTYRTRKIANLRSFNTLTRLCKARLSRKWVAAGDFNRYRGDDIVKAFLKVTEAEARGTGIDYLTFHNVRCGKVRKVNHGNSDHDPKVTTVYY